MNFKRYVEASDTWVDSHYVMGTSTDTITTPADIYANDTTATVGLKGNMSQTGTPSPTTPIQPSECGDRTGNLFDEVYSDISGTIRYRPIFVGDGTFTLSTTTPYDSSVANVFLLSGNVSSGASTPGNGAWKNHNVTAQSVDGYVTIAYRHYSGTTSPVDCQTMLNLSSTALPYEPWGIKIPILSASTTTPVYLGEVQSTRQIKKYEFTGQENITLYGASTTRVGFYFSRSDAILNGRTTGICSHFKPQATPSGSTINGVTFGANDKNFYFTFSADSVSAYNLTDITSIKTYLAQQYAAGTPVTVWYVLATETTGIVNEPLMKIGDYADTVSGITIPTIAGANSFDVLTTLKPSEVTVNYHGWHPVRSVHERENGAWT